MTGNDKLREENQALCKEIEELKNKLQKVQLIAEHLCVIYFELQSARLCIRLILDTWMRGTQIPQYPIGQVRRIQGHPTSIFGKYLFGRRFEIQKFRNICCKISCLLASPRIFEHLKKGKIAHLQRIFTLKRSPTIFGSLFSG